MKGKPMRVVAASLGVSTWLLSCMALSAPAVGATPGRPIWLVSGETIPTNLPPGGSGEYLVHVRNVGTAATDGSTITVTDRLPIGVTATAAGGQIEESQPLDETYWQCSGTAVVTCRNNPVNMPVIAPGIEKTAGIEGATAPLIAIRVAVAPAASGPGPNVVSVSGGGAEEATSTSTTTIGSPAPFGLASYEQILLGRNGLPATQAGSHPYELITNLALNNPGRTKIEKVYTSGELKDLEVGLPLGFVGNPAAVPRCPWAAFDEGRKQHEVPDCPADTQVGTATVALGYPFFVLLLPIYNLEPPADVPAQFGFAFQYRVVLIDGGMRTGEGNGLKVVLKNIDQLQALRSSVTLWGVPGDPSHDPERGFAALSGNGPPLASDRPAIPLLSNPTSCGTALSDVVSADSWEEPITEVQPFSYPVTAVYPVTDNKGQQLTMSRCAKLDFSPSLEVHTGSGTANSPTGLDAHLHTPQNERPEEEGHPQLAEAHLKDATVTLPEGMVVSPSAANGLQACSSAQIGLDNGNKPTCPDASKIGTVEVTTPLLEHPLEGSVYIAAQGDNPFGSLLAIYVVAEGSGVVIKLPGHVQADLSTGQLTTTFTENPQLPFSDLKLHFFSGPRAPLLTPASCGSYAPSAQLTGWNGALVVPSLEGFKVETGCTHGFSPTFSAGSVNNAADAFSPFEATIARRDGDQMLGAVSVTTPPGLLGMLSQVHLCGEPEAGLGTCPQSSLIGHTTAVAGPGPYPVTVRGGQVFLTGPYKGAPFGLSIAVPAVAGPFDLGRGPHSGPCDCVVVRASIHVDPHTARIAIVSDPLPTMLQGVPLQVRTVNVTADRPGFMFNPTNCNPLSVDGQVASAEGAGVSVSSRYQAADCGSLPFHPGFKASTWGGTSKKLGASLDVKVSSSAGQANIGGVVATLPKQLPARLTTLQQACPEATFAANPATCPAGSAVGIVRAVTPVLSEPVTGPAYLVSHGGAAFPDLVLILQAQGVRLDLVGNTNIKKSITTSTFAAVPDAPITSFELKVPQGPHSALAATLPASAHGSLCATKLTMPTTLTGQNGAQVKQSTRIAVSGCPKARAARRRHGRS